MNAFLLEHRSPIGSAWTQPFVYYLHDHQKMRASVVAAFLASCVPQVAAGRPRFLDECSVGGVLEYFTCRKHLHEACVSNLEEQATAFCRSYVDADAAKTVTVVVTTELPPVTVLTTVVSSTKTTEIEMR